MLNPELYVAFIVATAALILLPGPNVALIVATSLRYGAGRALLAVAGTSSAMVLQLTVAAFATGWVLVALSQWFELLRWLGVAYLLFLGLQQWRSAARAEDAPPPQVRRRALYGRGLVVALTNPKLLLFYGAFFPQFVDPALAAAPQLVVLSVSFLAIALVIDGGYALLGGRLGRWLSVRGAQRLVGRVGGAIMIGAAAGLALARRG